MSRAYQIVVVQTVQSETVHMADVLGHVPTAQFVSVLESEWAAQEQWQKQGDAYVLPLTEDVTIELRVTGESVVIERRVSAKVLGRLEAETRARQQQLLESTAADYRLRVNRLTGRVMLEAVAETLKEQHRIAGNAPVLIQEQDGRFELEVELVD